MDPLQVSTTPRARRRIVIIGPGASGKDWLREQINTHIKDAIIDVSYTTRCPRAKEVHGRDYHFVTTETFDTMLDGNCFYEWARFGKNLYGTSRDSWLASDVFIMSPGAVARMSASDRASCLVVLRDPPARRAGASVDGSQQPLAREHCAQTRR